MLSKAIGETIFIRTLHKIPNAVEKAVIIPWHHTSLEPVAGLEVRDLNNTCPFDTTGWLHYLSNVVDIFSWGLCLFHWQVARLVGPKPTVCSIGLGLPLGKQTTTLDMSSRAMAASRMRTKISQELKAKELDRERPQHNTGRSKIDDYLGFASVMCAFIALLMLYHQFYPTIHIKKGEEIVKMRVAGQLASEVLEYIKPFVKVGANTGDLNDLCHKYIVDVQKGRPAPLNYRGFPKSICTSVNSVVCHGIPSYEEVLEEGDILNIDITVVKDGYHGDTSMMYLLGEADDASLKLVKETITPTLILTWTLILILNLLVKETRAAMFEAIRMVRPGVTTGDLGHLIQTRATALGYGNVRDFTGHGTGLSFHEGVPVVSNDIQTNLF